MIVMVMMMMMSRAVLLLRCLSSNGGQMLAHSPEGHYGSLVSYFLFLWISNRCGNVIHNPIDRIGRLSLVVVQTTLFLCTFSSITLRADAGRIIHFPRRVLKSLEVDFAFLEENVMLPIKLPMETPLTNQMWCSEHLTLMTVNKCGHVYVDPSISLYWLHLRFKTLKAYSCFMIILYTISLTNLVFGKAMANINFWIALHMTSVVNPSFSILTPMFYWRTKQIH